MKARRTPSKLARIYVRVSTAGQAAEGLSLEAQEAEARKEAERQGLEVAGVHVDAGISGKRMENRPGLLEALEAVERERGTLIVYSLSRLSRSTKNALELAERIEKAGATLVSLSERLDTSTAAGKMTFTMLSALAQFERDTASERTATVLGHKREKGERVSRYAPFGFRFSEDGKRLEVDPREQRVMALVRRARDRGASYRRIVAHLNRFPQAVPPRGKAWHLRSVQLLLNPRNAYVAA